MRLLLAALLVALSLTGCAKRAQVFPDRGRRPHGRRLRGRGPRGQRALLPGVGDGNPGRERDQRIHRPGRGGYRGAGRRGVVPVGGPDDVVPVRCGAR